MSGVESRPFVGSWRADSQTVIQTTPDCIVTLNGYAELPGCPSCNGRIDIQQYITSVTADPNVEPPASASISMFIPTDAAPTFFRNGDCILKPGLEVRIYMRGFFAQKFLTRESAAAQGIDTRGFDASNVPVYPYYHVFHGVVTQVSSSYNNGDYTISMTCADTLHFWNTLRLSTNGSVFGIRPDNSLVEPTLHGHTFTGCSPYSIIYTLFRAGFGAAGGVEFQLEKDSNVDAPADALGLSLYKAAALYWETRWASKTMNLKMYGADGTLYNAFEQAFLGAYEGRSPEVLDKISSRPSSVDRNSFDASPDPNVAALMRQLGYNPLSSRVALSTTSDGKTVTSIDVTKMQAFVYDVSILGNVSVLQTEYATKMEIVDAVKEVTGFEFYQDVSGDLVFKPPFYNMDTSSDPVFVIEPSALYSIEKSDQEPDATMVKMKGTKIRANTNLGLEEWILPTAVFIDYRLVAQFGWKEAGPFECNYLTDTRSLYVSAINRLDLLNLGMHTASITIPLRPELRPGYPVYVRSEDSFYYITSMTHAFQFGAGCTTTIQGVARRSRFNAPGFPPKSREAGIQDIRLDNLYLPSVPLAIASTKYAGLTSASADFEEELRVLGAAGPLRPQGFPNVVMAINPERIKIDSVVSLSQESPDGIIQSALSLGILQVSPFAEGITEAERRYNGPYVLQQSSSAGLEVTKAQILSEYTAGNTSPQSAIGGVLQKVRTILGLDVQNTQNYLTLIKNNRATYAPGTSMQGEYRYYSCSHPEPRHQGFTGFRYSADSTEIIIPGGPLQSPVEVNGFNQNGGYGPLHIQTGIPIVVQGLDQPASVASVPTRDIYSVSFMQAFTIRSVEVDRQIQSTLRGIKTLESAVVSAIEMYLGASGDSPGDVGETIAERYAYRYGVVSSQLEGYYAVLQDLRLLPSAQNTFGSIEALLAARGVSNQAFMIDVFPPPMGQEYDDVIATSRFYVDVLAPHTTEIFEVATGIAYRALASGLDANPFGPELRATASEWVDTLQGLLSNLSAELPEDDAIITDDEPIDVAAFVSTPSTSPDYTPVYPVSDHAGYEVYGAFPYGRGLTVSTFLSLMSGDAGGVNPLTLGGIVNTTSTSSLTLGAIESLLENYRLGQNLNSNFNDLSPEEQQLVIQAIPSADRIYDGPDDSTPGSFNLELTLSRLGQTPATQNRILASNIPVELAAIDVGDGEACSCLSYDAQIFLQAAALDPKTYRPVVQLWQDQKDAYSGANADTRQGDLAARFAPFQRDDSRFFLNPVREASQEVGQSLGDVNQAAQRIRDNLRRGDS
jgi:hypothetical protein